MTEAERIEKSYFHLSKNEHGSMWLMYRPDSDGRYNCWEPITGEFWQEFEKLQSAAAEHERLQQLIKENEQVKISFGRIVHDLKMELKSAQELNRELVGYVIAYKGLASLTSEEDIFIQSLINKSNVK